MDISKYCEKLKSEKGLINIECDIVDLYNRLVDNYNNDRKFIQKEEDRSTIYSVLEYIKKLKEWCKMWICKRFDTRQELEKFIKEHENDIQYTEILVNNGYGVEYRKLKKIIIE